MEHLIAFIDEANRRLLESYETSGGINFQHDPNLPSRDGVIDIVKRIESLLFPGFFRNERIRPESLRYVTGTRIADLYEILVLELSRDLHYQQRLRGEPATLQETEIPGRTIASGICKNLPEIRERISLDIEALYSGDPAARSHEEVILSYPGLRAMIVYRIAHVLWNSGARLVARMMSEFIHSRTGIDIHPGAEIGDSFYIDHGTGVVIGETTVIGSRVKIYQGVTLGALSVSKKLNADKRHPTIEDNVTIYAGATILGGNTVIGRHSVVGGNVWLVQSVPAYSLVENSPSIRVIPKNGNEAEWHYSI